MHLILSASGGFGGGLAGMRLTCGALLGGAFALGFLLPYPENLIAVRILKRNFELEFGYTFCKDLIGSLNWHPYELKKFIKRKRLCLEIVGKTALWVKNLSIDKPKNLTISPSCYLPQKLPYFLQRAAKVFEGGLAYTFDICGIVILKIMNVSLLENKWPIPLQNVFSMIKSHKIAVDFKKKTGSLFCKDIKGCFSIY
ncbi:MAG: C-GCAxxG-C-C family protein [Candidatus Desulfofervidus auxilii]|nr:C-GCAxxG-C-C family protein [Candidatus Desulfofervidus auxilii]